MFCSRVSLRNRKNLSRNSPTLYFSTCFENMPRPEASQWATPSPGLSTRPPLSRNPRLPDNVKTSIGVYSLCFTVLRLRGNFPRPYAPRHATPETDDPPILAPPQRAPGP